MGMTVTPDKMVHTNAVHHDLDRSIGLEGCCAFGGEGKDLNPIDLVAMGVASCLMIVMANSGKGKGLDLTGTWADTAYELKDYKIASTTVTIHSPYRPSEDNRLFLEKEAHRCPVYLVVKDGTAVSVAFEWGSGPACRAGRGRSDTNRRQILLACVQLYQDAESQGSKAMPDKKTLNRFPLFGFCAYRAAKKLGYAPGRCQHDVLLSCGVEAHRLREVYG